MKLFMQETVEKYNMITAGDRIICGVSGGADSVAMLFGLLELKNRASFSLCAAHLDHMLRGEESVRDREFVRGLCERHGVEFFTQSIDINALAAEAGESIELAARNARYAFFDRVLNEWKGNKIATAHNADDNLETMLMHLARGCALNGLGGIPPVRGNIIRPLIETTREQILEYLSGIAQDFVEDSTNSMRFCVRNSVRLDVMPIMRDINPRAAQAAAQSAQAFREDEQCLAAMAEKIGLEEMEKNQSISIEIERLHGLPDAIRRRVVLFLARKAVEFTNYYLEFNHICDIIELTYKSEPCLRIDLPGGLAAVRKYDKLVFEKAKPCEKPKEAVLEPGGCVTFGKFEISCTPVQKNDTHKPGKMSFAIPVSRISGGLTVRSRRTGDEIKLSGRPRKTLKKLFIDEKIPKDERDGIPVLAASGGICAVCGFGADEKFKAVDKEDIYWVEIRRIQI